MKKSFSLLFASIFTVLSISCSKDEPKVLKSIQLDRPQLSIFYDDTVSLNVSINPIDVELKPQFIWSSETERVAKVNQKGLVAGNKIGETTVFVKTDDGKFSAECKVTVTPRSNLFTEPIVDFGLTYEAVKLKVAKTPIAETNGVALFYSGENSHVKMNYYGFENRVLNASAVMLEDNLDAKNIATLEETALLPVFLIVLV